ncbi:eukaryotic aspartyl protease [Opisthorchis viverrini]|uniref:Eukaryotic aspartyl protease n=1 Tax=Opisthorchis viverrini TaxID=6198 RepID=A0A1S8WZ11_OPIVI|nr:eukaryotic aspartyl protease [Opisthorchis viverrini]
MRKTSASRTHDPISSAADFPLESLRGLDPRKKVNTTPLRFPLAEDHHPLKHSKSRMGYVFVDVTVGTPGQELSIEVDTSFGTSLIVAQVSSRGKVYINYKVYASTTKTVGEQVCTAIGTRELTGRKNADVFRIGEYRFAGFNFQMIERMNERPGFLDFFSGKLGLAPVSAVTQETFAQSILRLFPDDPVFTFWFRPDEDGVYRSGIFSFGGVHEYRYVGNMVYVPLVTPGNSWTIEATKISLGENILCQQDCKIQINTGVRYFYASREQIEEIHRLLQIDMDRKSTGVYLLEYGEADSYPSLIIEFGVNQLKWRMDELWEKKKDRGRIICKSGMRFTSSLSGWVFGHKLMYKLFTVFDMKNSRIGMAEASRP